MYMATPLYFVTSYIKRSVLFYTQTCRKRLQSILKGLSTWEDVKVLSYDGIILSNRVCELLNRQNTYSYRFTKRK